MEKWQLTASILTVPLSPYSYMLVSWTVIIRIIPMRVQVFMLPTVISIMYTPCMVTRHKWIVRKSTWLKNAIMVNISQASLRPMKV